MPLLVKRLRRLRGINLRLVQKGYLHSFWQLYDQLPNWWGGWADRRGYTFEGPTIACTAVYLNRYSPWSQSYEETQFRIVTRVSYWTGHLLGCLPPGLTPRLTTSEADQFLLKLNQCVCKFGSVVGVIRRDKQTIITYCLHCYVEEEWE